jgi:Bacteriophage head to tail connecting protein
MTPKQLRGLADHLFSKRGQLMSLWQEIAEHFYVERADFTATRTIGEDFAAHLSSSYPLLVRRDLGDQLGTMLRPKQKEWKRIVPKDTSIKDNLSLRWMTWADEVMRKAMYDNDSLFTQATKQADHDFATFGQCVMSIQLNRFRDTLLYRTWHLKDVVWREDQEGKIDFIGRKWKVAVIDLRRLFPAAPLDSKITDKIAKDPFYEIDVMHMVASGELWDGKTNGRPRVSVFYDMTHNKVIEEVPIWGRIYIVPRWQTVSGSQYAFSPATVCALPEGRLLQSMTLTIMEAGEKSTNPPMIATKDAVKSDMQQFPGGVTWVDADYDERLGQALRTMNIDVRGLPISLEMLQDSRGVLQQCFFLNKLRAFNPNTDPEMTAFQAGQIVQEYIRGALPLFEPMEMEYNGAMCEETFEVMYRNGGFGSPLDLPDPLRNADIEFQFESPLHDAIEQQKGIKFLEFKQIVTEAVTLDPSSMLIPDAKIILRDVANGIRVPPTWMRGEMEVDDLEAEAREKQAQQEALAALEQGAGAVKDLGTARKDLAVVGP